ncbi:hypothetical protein F7725_007577 [Dissostichus mawsoni]|uniref:COMM domain-containing protein n=1 Tax=Dissostichus mawsoni TaxID=36200 RepID=A0A7J5Y4S7_DISMA|nr:hypothetical protein F7725_007577 [Dissostichus mawsoni]
MTSRRRAEAEENMVVLLSRLPATECIKGGGWPVWQGAPPQVRAQQHLEPGGVAAAAGLPECLLPPGSGSDSSEEEVLGGLADVGSSHAEAVLSVLRARREEIHRALLDRTNSISSATLQDFDWQLKLSLSSDKISSLHTPLLSLSLDVREDAALRSVTMEMNREELNTLISSLEAANKVVLQLK